MASDSIWQILGRLIRYAPKLYCVDTLLWLFIAGLPIVPGVLIREFFNSLTQDAGRFSSLSESPWIWITLLLAVGLARVVAIFIGRITKTQHRFLISALIRHNLLSALLKRPGAELLASQKTSPGEILNYFRDDASHIEDTVASTNEIFAEAVFAIVSMGLLLSVNATMTWLVFMPLCAIAFLVHQAEHRIKRYRRASREATGQVTGLIAEMFTAVQAIKVAGAEAGMLHELKQRGDHRQQLTVRDRLFTALLNSGFESIVSLGTALILLLAAQNLQPSNTQSSLTVGDFALFVYYLSFITYFLAFVGSFLAVTQQSEVSFERMADLTSNRLLQHKQTKALHALTFPHSLYLQPLRGSLPPLPSTCQTTSANPLRELRVTGLTYRYPDSKRGIHNISFTLKQGTLTVITGGVGTGKTTLLRVLLGLLSRQSGHLFWNDQPIHDPALFLVPPQSAYTPQIPQLFSASLRDNLLLGSSETNVLERAIATAAFDQDLAALPDGLETLIGTRGFRLSGGQKQRVAAARMLLRQPELLVFDDLSSALDIKTEQQLWTRLFDTTLSPAHRPTCLVVSHRPSLLKRADQIVALEAGKIVFSGTAHDFHRTRTQK